MKKSVLATIITICVCILGLVLINKRNEDVKESGSFSQEEYYLEEPEEISDEKQSGVLSHQDLYYDESEEIPEDEDGLTPISSDTYWAVEEE